MVQHLGSGTQEQLCQGSFWGLAGTRGRDSAVPNVLRLGVSPESHSQTLSEDYRLGPGWAFWSCFGMHWGLCRHPEELRAVVG